MPDDKDTRGNPNYCEFPEKVAVVNEDVRKAISAKLKDMSNQIQEEMVKKSKVGRDSLGTKIDPGGKLRVDLIPPEWLYMLAAVAQSGLLKGYEVENWHKGIKARTLLGSALRHTLDSMHGHDIDDESGLAAAAHGAWDLLCFAYQHVMYKDNRKYACHDDRPFKEDGSKYPPMIQDFLDKATGRAKGGKIEMAKLFEKQHGCNRFDNVGPEYGNLRAAEIASKIEEDRPQEEIEAGHQNIDNASRKFMGDSDTVHPDYAES